MAGAGHDFVVVIPVADRPRHLTACLDSLKTLLATYPYAGRVSVLVADDSRDEASRQRHREIVDACGLDAHYLGQDEQRALVADLPVEDQGRLTGVVGSASAVDFHHKGASITRNIAYLWLRRLPDEGRPRLFWFLDSDQEFRVNVATDEGEVLAYAVDYLHALDRIFSTTPARVLTGKVVGDPPVSPAVMAGNFLDDVLAFLAEMATRDSAAVCTFHGPVRAAGDAAYHDMADLFGFRGGAEAFRYRCPLAGAHDHAACFADFAARLDRFFDGEHPTRRSYYEAGDPLDSLKPARTIYTGNYVFTVEGLDGFIPFADLKLRMAGPTLGRLLRAELGEAFVSANLPMLHKRTVAETGQSECRPGIDRQRERVDLSGEFERQYFGDVMLFGIERLTGQGFPSAPLARDRVEASVAEVETQLRDRYRARQADTAARLDRLEALFEAPANWWHARAGLAGACSDFRRFFANLRANFAADAPVWRQLGYPSHRDRRLAAMTDAIARYRDDQSVWRQVMRRAE